MNYTAFLQLSLMASALTDDPYIVEPGPSMRDLTRKHAGHTVAVFSGGTYHKKAEPGRNDPCSCGSGKKYKKCCMKHV